MRLNYIKFVLISFFLWRLYLILLQIAAIYFVPIQGIFLGGGFIRQWSSPYFLPWANFDGEHYLSIAIYGYKYLEQAFFPTYPLLIRFLAGPFGRDEEALSAFGIIISNISLIGSLLILWKLIRLDYSNKIASFSITSLLVFPTSFYLGAVYNESLFLFLSLLSFYFARTGKWFYAGTVGGIASATRVFGILLLPALFLEAWKEKIPFNKYFWIILIPSGLLIYMLYQKIYFGDPFLYYKLQLLVGEQHQRGIILLPQVFFRYLKILLTVNPSNLIYQTVVLEFIVGILFAILPILAYIKKVRISYIFYLAVGFIMPTIQGSLSSVPRYVLVLFPAFITISLIVSRFPLWGRVLYLFISLSWLALETMLFLRGYWVA